MIMEWSVELGEIKSKLEAYDRQNHADGTPDDEATSLLATCHEAYAGRDAQRDKLRIELTAESFDAMYGEMPKLRKQMAALDRAFDARQNAYLLQVTDEFRRQRAELRELLGANDMQGRPDDTATNELGQGEETIVMVETLLKQLEACDDPEEMKRLQVKVTPTLTHNAHC